MTVTCGVTCLLLASGVAPRTLAPVAAVAGVALIALIASNPYQQERLTGFIDPGGDPGGAGYQSLQAEIALGSGGVMGVGLGESVQKAFYLPEAHTDMIPAVIGEELGLLGILGVVGLFALLGYAGLRVAQRARDRYSKLLVAGLTSMILVQATINLFAVMGLAPLTGVPLPFVSYGNSSLLVTLFAVGLILGVARGGTAAAGKLRVVEGGRSPARKRSRSSRGKSTPSRGGSGGDRRPRRAGDGRRRRASG
jgi:cell division protein FtsW